MNSPEMEDTALNVGVYQNLEAEGKRAIAGDTDILETMMH
jgi:hypothetical protein